MSALPVPAATCNQADVVAAVNRDAVTTKDSSSGNRATSVDADRRARVD